WRSSGGLSLGLSNSGSSGSLHQNQDTMLSTTRGDSLFFPHCASPSTNPISKYNCLESELGIEGSMSMGRSAAFSPSKQRMVEAAQKGIPVNAQPQLLTRKIKQTLQSHATWLAGGGVRMAPLNLNGADDALLISDGASKNGVDGKNSYPTLLRTTSSPRRKRRQEKDESLPPMVLNRLSPLPWKLKHAHDFTEKNRSQESLHDHKPDAKLRRIKTHSAF
ncbi:unnamed protein product, partial [Amoebophrya sp. A25]